MIEQDVTYYDVFAFSPDDGEMWLVSFNVIYDTAESEADKWANNRNFMSRRIGDIWVSGNKLVAFVSPSTRDLEDYYRLNIRGSIKEAYGVVKSTSLQAL